MDLILVVLSVLSLPITLTKKFGICLWTELLSFAIPEYGHHFFLYFSVKESFIKCVHKVFQRKVFNQKVFNPRPMLCEVCESGGKTFYFADTFACQLNEWVSLYRLTRLKSSVLRNCWHYQWNYQSTEIFTVLMKKFNHTI